MFKRSVIGESLNDQVDSKGKKKKRNILKRLLYTSKNVLCLGSIFNSRTP